MRKVGQGPSVGRTSPRCVARRTKVRRRDEQSGHEAARDQKHAHYERSGHEQSTGMADAACWVPLGIFGTPLTSGITATPVSKPDRPSASLRKEQERDSDHRRRAGVAGKERPLPLDNTCGVRHLIKSHHKNDSVEQQVNASKAERDAYRLVNPFRNTTPSKATGSA